MRGIRPSHLPRPESSAAVGWTVRSRLPLPLCVFGAWAMSAWYEDVKVGDMLNVDPEFNKSERPPNRIANPARVLDVITGVVSQSRVMFCVATGNGGTRTLDAGWFTGKAS